MQGPGGVVKNRRQGNTIQPQQMKREFMTDKDWDIKFEMLFNEDFIKLEDNFFDEDLCFTDPSDLNKIFSELEEQNLYLIHQSQELEIALENERRKQKENQDDLGRQADQHKKNRNELMD